MSSTQHHLQRPVVWDPMAHTLVHAGAHALWEPAIIQTRGVGVVVYNEPAPQEVLAIMSKCNCAQ